MQNIVCLCRKSAKRRLMTRFVLLTAAAAALLTFTFTPAGAQQMRSTRAYLAQPVPRAPKILKSHIVIPSSNQLATQDVGKKMHTNYRLLVPDVEIPATSYPPYSGYLYETPESIACLYATVTYLSGCNPNSTVNVPTGGSQSIAIVDAFDNPTVAGDLAYFSDQMGIPFKTSQFHIVYAAGYQPSLDYSGGWELEAALDVEWAHAMAPSANIYLVEAASNYDTDLFQAVQVATNLVRCGLPTTCTGTPTGKGEVSMSWGGSESSGETAYDSYLSAANNVVYLAAAGDGPGVIYPSASPYVISVGGTAISRSISTGSFYTEAIWQDTGGGPSAVEALPTYQTGLGGTKRITPDVAADADPATGVWVYSSFPQDGYFAASSWWVVGGTSASTQIWAGILNAASTANGAFAASTSAELTMLYADMAGASYASDLKDIVTGSCGPYDAYFAATKYDKCTGVGVPHTYAGK